MTVTIPPGMKNGGHSVVGYADEVIEERLSIVSGDALQDARFISQSVELQRVRAVMCVPLEASDGVVGALYLDSSRRVNAFGSRDLELFAIIGWWPRVLRALGDRKAMVGTTTGAVFGPFLGVSLSLVAVQHTQAGVATTIMALVPVLIIVPSVLIKKERVSPRAVFGAIVAVSGAALLFL